MCLSKIRVPTRLKGIIWVDCGYCYMCLQKKRSEWTFRLLQQHKISESSRFVTLTYNDDFLVYADERPTVYHRDLTLYFNRLRSKAPSLRYYAVSEYGDENKRPHYHAIIFNANDVDIVGKWTKRIKGEGRFPIGNVHLGDVNQASIHYVTKYQINRVNYPEGTEKPKSFVSKGLGLNYVTDTQKFYSDTESDFIYWKNGYKQILPRYYQQKLFTIRQRKRIFKKYQQIIDEYEKRRIQKLGAETHFERQLNTHLIKNDRLIKFSKSKKV